MSLFSSTSKSTTTGTTAPTNPKPVTDSLIDFTKLISSLGKRDPRQFVTGPSNLQNAAFGMGAGIAQRYGIGVPQGQMPGQMPGKPQINQLPTNYNTPEGQMNTQVAKPQINQVPTNAYTPEGQMSVQMGKPQYSQNTAASMYGSPGVTSSLPITTGQGPSQGGGLFERAGIQQTPDTGPQQLSAQNYTPDPELKAGWARVRERPKDQAYIRSTGGDYDNNGSISEEEYYNWHRSQFNDRESYQPQTLAAQQATQVPQGGGQGFGGGVSAAPGIGYTAAQMGQNPNDVYRDATDMARGVGMAGPNRGQLASLGQANTYGASGPANVGGYDASRASAQGYDAQSAGSRGYDAATIGEAERVRMGPASQASASQGIQFSQPYENRFTDNVVNTTLANMDEFSGRQRAQEAADAARNNAFSGSRFGVQRAITEEQIARERASQEAGLRFGAQDRAFGLGMQDAGMASQVSQSNAAAANQMAQAQAMMDQQRLMANMDARNQAGQFGAAAGNQAAMFNAGSQNTARQFGAGAQNQANMFNAQAADAAGQFGAQARNLAQMDFAGRQDTAGQFNAGAQNQFDLSQFGAANNMSQFNAGMDESSLMRALAASGQMGQLAGAQGNNERADLQMLSQLGNDERTINQQSATADLQLMQMMAQLYGQMPYNLFTGQNTSGTQTGRYTPSGIDSFNSALDAGSKVAAMFSDIRLKTDIEPQGERNGHAWYSYRYVWDEPGKVREGVMAQEVIQTRPDAVITHPLGFLMVDYAALGLEFAQ